MFTIIKKIKIENIILPVILIDHQNEVLEFETLEEANRMKEIFEFNSDSGHKYEVKKIGN